MAELPSARLNRTPLQRLVAYCKPLVIVALLLAPIWYAVHRCTEPETPPELSAREYVDHAVDDAGREKVRPYLAKLHDKARTHLRTVKAPNPHGLDPLLNPLLRRVDYQLMLDIKQHVDDLDFVIAFRHPGDDVGNLIVSDLMDRDRCAMALTAVFEKATGSDVIQVVTRYGVERYGPEPILTVRWDIRPRHDDAPDRIIAKGTAELSVGGAVVVSEPFEMSSTVTVAGSTVRPKLLDDLCTRIGGQLVERLTGLREDTDSR